MDGKPRIKEKGFSFKKLFKLTPFILIAISLVVIFLIILSLISKNDAPPFAVF